MNSEELIGGGSFDRDCIEEYPTCIDRIEHYIKILTEEWVVHKYEVGYLDTGSKKMTILGEAYCVKEAADLAREYITSVDGEFETIVVGCYGSVQTD